MGMSLTFAFVLESLEWVAPHTGLALATSLTALINASLLYRGLRRTGVYQPGAGWLSFAFRLGMASLVMGALLWALAGDLSDWMAWGLQDRAWRLAGLIAAGLFTYVAILLIGGLRPRHLSAPRH